MLNDVQRFLNYLSELDDGFARWASSRDREGYARKIIGDFSIDELQASTDRLLASIDFPASKRTIFALVRREIFSQRDRDADGLCPVCFNERLISVVSHGSLAEIASGKLAHVRATSLKCECRASAVRSFQQARRNVNCVIEFEQMLDEAGDREKIMSRDRNGAPLPVGFSLLDIAIARTVFDWISAHRLTTYIDDSGSEIDFDRFDPIAFADVIGERFTFYDESIHLIGRKIRFFFEERDRFTTVNSETESEPSAPPTSLEGGDTNPQGELFGDG